ncbi:hypothetical protein O6H91_16G059300 [Diphasiastrum complanatum]|uniref:Uncharacterized protein n=1 Tax=Diphasiastrum complanatum TaxID=34168 RepID=A0ACC2BCM6_DIPCM|nr:hypothetical protein O6H91_16G059300 [Diphasiastrum complanatum]
MADAVKGKMEYSSSSKSSESSASYDPTLSPVRENETDLDQKLSRQALALVISIGTKPQRCENDDERHFEMLQKERPGKDPGFQGTMSSNWTLWQLLDSVFPTGGFAHSLGLEAAVQTGFVHDPSTLVSFITSTLENTAALLLPFVFVSNKLPRVDCWIHIDRLLHATLTNQVARRASCALGSALLRTATTVYVEIQELKKMRACALNSGMVHCHHAAVFGVVTGLLAIDPLTSQRSYLFLSLRDCLSAATRLNLVGPLEAAAMQRSMSSLAERIVAKYANRPIEDAYQTAPLLDVVQGYHDNLFSRLFCS